jgi:hypothetical protein
VPSLSTLYACLVLAINGQPILPSMDQLARAAEGGAICRDAEPPAKARRAVVANEQLRGCVAVAESKSMIEAAAPCAEPKTGVCGGDWRCMVPLRPRAFPIRATCKSEPETLDRRTV